jgi:hypothetical protein
MPRDVHFAEELPRRHLALLQQRDEAAGQSIGDRGAMALTNT